MGMLNRLYLYYLKRKGISVGRNVKINGRIFLSGTRNIIIDDDVYINSNEKSNPIGGNTKCYLKRFNCYRKKMSYFKCSDMFYDKCYNRR